MSLSKKLLHNNNCSKSRNVLEALNKEGIEIEVIEYMKSPLSEDEMLEIIDNLDGELKELIRINQKEYKDLGFDYGKMSRNEVAKLLIDEPKVMQRPIFIDENKKSIVVRDEEKLEKILSN